ncbi:hypothetical protein [Thermotalea metallivorans]|uniref:Uncharacterized protein n=1 Tax=Thermotalea metallivorans TaxID=520762 RepID=A0A140L1B6_9FIRM|nr:hypothetical protein [Thermotalea metallivorans]KXG74341.1 hypothetical protein AN619_24340 [Thermotalea metallivorans]
MQIALSDLVDSCDDGTHFDLNVCLEDTKNDLKFLRDLKKFLKKYNKSTSQIDQFIHRLEGNMDIEKVIQVYDIDENAIKKSIEKHPYFKNPCDYPIRLITIMKYLKKKGFDTHYKDMDLIVDRLIQEIDGVKKVGEGMYLKKMH